MRTVLRLFVPPAALALALSGVGHVSASVSTATPVSASTSVVVNGGFEEPADPPTGLPRAWSATSYAHVASTSWVTDVHRGGASSVRISSASPDDAAWVQTVAVRPHTRYRLSGWIRTDGVTTAGRGATLSFYGTWTHTPALTGTHGWAFASVVMDSGDQQQLTVGARLGYWSDTAAGTAWFDDVELTPIEPVSPAPSWKVLVLIYPHTDFTSSDSSGVQHHYVGSMTSAQTSAAAVQATAFVTKDIPALDSGAMVPTVTVRYPDRALALDGNGTGYWPSPVNTAPERDPAFDSVIVIWQPTVVDSVTGRSTWIGSAAGLTPPMGTGQTYTTLIIEAATSYGHRNVFKHEFGHSILGFFDAAGTAPVPTVTNHAVAGQYVHCPTGQQYVWTDESDAKPVPNSIYNNGSGFTHDYYSGTTATGDLPGRCLGVSPNAWAYGGPLRLGPVLRLPSSGPVAAGYRMRDLGTLGGASSAAVAVSTTGYAVGWAQNAAGQRHAVRWDPAGAIRDLGTLGGPTSAAVAVNDDGSVVGSADKADGTRQAFRWTASTGIRDLGTLGGATSSAADINRAGQVTGTARRRDGVEHAFVWSAATGMRDLGSLGAAGTPSSALAINDAGQIAGWSALAGDAGSTLFRWSPQSGLTDIFAASERPYLEGRAVSADINESGQIAAVVDGYTPGQGVEGEWVIGWDPKKGLLPMSFTLHSKGFNGHAADINDSGQIAGTTEYPYPPEGTPCWTERAFRSDPNGTTRQASIDGDCQSVGRAVNSAGEVVGQSLPSGHAFVWDPATGEQLLDLGTLGGATSDALALADTGRVVGIARKANGASHAVEWDPPAGTVTSTVVAVQDTYVNRSAPSTAFGFSSSLAAGNANTYLTYLRYNVPPAPTGRTLAAATLQLRTTTSSTAGTTDALEVRQASPDWSEGATTWNNRPTTGPAHLGNLGPVPANSNASVRLEPSALIPGTPVNLVVNSSGDSAWFWSRTSAPAGFRPTLVLVYR